MPRAIDVGPDRGPAPEHFIARFDRSRQRFTVLAGEGYFSAEIEDIKGVLPSGMLWRESDEGVRRVCTYLWNTGCLAPIPGMDSIPDGVIELDRDIRERKLILRVGDVFLEASFDDLGEIYTGPYVCDPSQAQDYYRTQLARLWASGVLRPHDVPAWLYE